MSQEVGLLRAFAPELDGIRKRMYGLTMASNERAAKVDSLQVMLLRLKVRDLANVVAGRLLTLCQTLE